MAIPVETLYTNRALGLGRIAEHNPITNIRSYAAEEDDVKFGRAVMEGTDRDKQCKLFASASGTLIGIAGYSTRASSLDDSLYDDGDPVSVIDQGVVTVYTEEAVEPNSTVRIRHDATGPGNFRTTADAGKTVQVTAGMKFRETAASGTAVKLFLSPPFTITAD